MISNYRNKKEIKATKGVYISRMELDINGKGEYINELWARLKNTQTMSENWIK